MKSVICRSVVNTIYITNQTRRTQLHAKDITPSDRTVSMKDATLCMHQQPPSIFFSCFVEILAPLQILIILKCHIIYPFSPLTLKFLQKMLFFNLFFVCHDTELASTSLLKKQFLTKEKDFLQHEVPKCTMFYFGPCV